MPGNASHRVEKADKARRSRITAACAVCRAKRQRCSGTQPCEHCRVHNEECRFVEQKKRGPTKDHLRALQDRLQDTEQLLCGVLGLISDDQLSKVQTAASDSGASHQVWSTSMSGPEYWSRYSLNSLHSIRGWQHDQTSKRRKPGLAWGQAVSQAPRASIELGAAQIPLPSPSLASVRSAELQANPASGQTKSSQHSRQLAQGDLGPDPAWVSHENEPVVSIERRYSEETRDVAKTLFSISNNNNAVNAQGGAPQETSAMDDPESSATPDTPASRFPKHLFW